MLSDEIFLGVIAATPLVSIDLIIRNEQGQILLGQCTNRPAMNFWFVPGGRIRKNERVQEALRRISAKELGVTLEQARLVGVFDHIYDDNFLGKPGINTHYVVLGMEAQWPHLHEARQDEQHQAFRWWPVPELLASADVHENTKAYFRR